MKDLSGFNLNVQLSSGPICSCTGSHYSGTGATGPHYSGTGATGSYYSGTGPHYSGTGATGPHYSGTGPHYSGTGPHYSGTGPHYISDSSYQFEPYGVKNKTLFLGYSGTSYYFSDGSNNSSGSYLIDSSNNVFADQSIIGYVNKYIYKNIDEANENNKSYNKKISVSKEIANYFNLSHTLCNFNDLVYAILNKSKDNKVNTNSIQSVNFSKESTICLDGYGKKLFKIKCNFIEINCLIDFILQQKSSDYFYYENEQKPVHVNSLY